MSDGEDDVTLAACVELLRGVVAAERQGLFAENLLVRGCRGDHLRQVQRVRGRQQHHIDGAVVEDGVEITRQIEIMFGAKASRPLDVGLDRARYLEAAMAMRRANQVAAPATEPNNRAIDHLNSLGTAEGRM